jgi:endogenous inhibitor of DNA gyrase (YacG/DUF329 family)
MLCPICKKHVEEPHPGEASPRYFPFCSDRCKLIDLGRWLGGKYQVPVEITPDDDDEPTAPPPPPPPRR